MRSGGKRFVELIGWCAVGGTGVVMVTQAMARPRSRPIAVIQTLTPYLALAMAPVGLVALTGRRVTMALTASAVGVAGLALARPLASPPALPAVAADASALRIAALNLLYTNDEDSIAMVADDLRGRDLDVITFVEYTAGHERVLRDSGLADDFPSRIERSGPGASGIAIWSRSPVVVGDHADTTDRILDATVKSAAGPVRVLAVHAHTPTNDFEIWKADLEEVGDLGISGGDPTLVIGDFNASFWHPNFRAMLRKGFTDAHIALHRGFSVSWPTDVWYPPFVRLDHALTTDSLVPTGIEDFDIPGSDHRGLIITVLPVR